MRWHELKTDPEVFDAVAAGVKTFEIRRNDRDYQPGDGLLLRRTRNTGWAMKNTRAPLEYTGEELRVSVTYVLRGPVYGLDDGWAILSIATSGAQACRYTNKPGGACWRQGKAAEICTCHTMTDKDFAESVKRHADCRAPRNAGVAPSDQALLQQALDTLHSAQPRGFRPADWERHNGTIRALEQALAAGVVVPARGNTTCNPHPDAPHGLNRNASHDAGRYVCDCEGWMPPAGVMASGEARVKRISDALRAMQEMWDHLRRKGLNEVLMREYSSALEVLEQDFMARLPDGGMPVAPTEQWRPMETAPTDGTMVRLLVDYRGEDSCHPLEDAEVTHTIGGNTDGHTGLNEGWKFAGWSWEQDCFCEGRGKPLGWLPLAPVPAGVAVTGHQTFSQQTPMREKDGSA